MQLLDFKAAQQLFLAGDMLAQRLQQPLALQYKVIGEGRGREFHFPAKFIIGPIQTEMLVLDAGAISGFRETQKRRIGIFFFLAAVLTDFDDFMLHGLELAESLAAHIAIRIGKEIERVFPNIQKVQNLGVLGVSGFKCLM